MNNSSGSYFTDLGNELFLVLLGWRDTGKNVREKYLLFDVIDVVTLIFSICLMSGDISVNRDLFSRFLYCI